MRSDPGVNAMQTAGTGGMRLNANETAMLCGDRGAAAREALQIQIEAGSFFEARCARFKPSLWLGN